MTAINHIGKKTFSGQTLETQSYNLGNIATVNKKLLAGNVAEINIGNIRVLKRQTLSGLSVATLSIGLFSLELYDNYWSRDWLNAEPTYTVSGKVTAKGVAVNACRVELRNRDANSRFIRTAMTDAAGEFSFEGVHGGKAGYYYIVAIDPTLEPDYNAVISDRINELNPVVAVDFSATNQAVKKYYHQAWDGEKWVAWQSDWSPDLTPAATLPEAAGGLVNIFLLP